MDVLFINNFSLDVPIMVLILVIKIQESLCSLTSVHVFHF